VQHLPAYVALARLVLARRVVVVMPESLEGPRRLLQAGARELLVIGDDLPSEPGIVSRPGSTRLPLRDRSVDVVCCIEALAQLPGSDRRQLLTEAHRILRPDGLFAGWVEYDAGAESGSTGVPAALDFWTLEDELASLFDEVAMLAQMPWQGFSLAPIVDDEGAGEPGLRLEEGLLAELPEASHYLAVAGKSALPATLVRDCVLVPVPGDVDTRSGVVGELEDKVHSMRDEVDRLRESLSMRAAKGAAAQARVRELEGQLENVRASVGSAKAEELERAQAALDAAEAQLDAASQREQETRERIEDLESLHAKLSEEHQALQVKQQRLEQDLDARSRTAQGGVEELGELRDRLEKHREENDARDSLLRSRETDLAILTRTVEDQEKALARVSEGLEERKQDLKQAREQEQALREKLEALGGERDELRRQVDVLIAEREGARKLATRVEAELEVARKRLSKQEASLAQKTEEATRLDVEANAMKARLGEQEALLAQTREKAEELSAQAAQGQMLSEVALDRDRLREELRNRQQQITSLEERLWESHENVQKEKIEAVRLTGEVDRLREQLERSHAAEKERVAEFEDLAKKLRELEVDRAALTARLEARNERIEQLEGEASQLAGESADAKSLNERLQARGNEISTLKEKLAESERGRKEASERTKKRETELDATRKQVEALNKTIDGHSKLGTKLQAEIDVKSVEVEQIATTVASLQEKIAEYRGTIAAGEQSTADQQRKLEQAASEQQTLRARLRERDQEVEDLTAARENDSIELYNTRKEFEAASQANQKLEDALALRSDEAKKSAESKEWPDEAVEEVRRLKEEIATLARRHANELSEREDRGRSQRTGERGRVRRLQLEVSVRSAEQEFMLGQLDAAEQKIWEMNDASDRNAARFEASLAQLERHKEKIDQLTDELEVTRTVLAAEQARALEFERLLASERAKMARAGLGLEGFPKSDPLDDPFADLANGDVLDLSEGGGKKSGVPDSAFELDSELIRLSDSDDDPQPLETGAVRSTIDDRGSGRVGSWRGKPGADRAPKRARLHVETIDEDDDEWPDDDAD
jgi:chromosome segregation ATPase